MFIIEIQNKQGKWDRLNTLRDLNFDDAASPKKVRAAAEKFKQQWENTVFREEQLRIREVRRDEL